VEWLLLVVRQRGRIPPEPGRTTPANTRQVIAASTQGKPNNGGAINRNHYNVISLEVCHSHFHKIGTVRSGSPTRCSLIRGARFRGESHNMTGIMTFRIRDERRLT
jgi:hypothetical protein